ncbi:MAG: hypothetical protein JSU88_02090 [Nitrospinaceae bacterium]|nr:MAG: hypothetical protein JSU88_02090 [Nitrospinaceae bacterium]
MPSLPNNDGGERRRLIAVVGSGSEPHADIARPLGRWLAHEGYHLLSGGGQGVMAETAVGFRSVLERGGLAIGILPGLAKDGKIAAPPGYPNPSTDLAIRTHLPLTGAEGQSPMSRNAIIVLTADAVVALPGAEGTRSEIELALAHHVPLLLFSPGGEWAAYEDRAPAASRLEEVFAWVGEAAPKSR